MIKTELVNGDSVIAKIDSLEQRIRDELKIGIGRASLKLSNKVKQDKLVGQVLKVRTDRLRNSVGQIVVEDGKSIVGIVSSPVKYAAFQEYGFSGTESVREHLRQAKARFRPGKGKRFDVGPVTVRAHTRQVNYPAHSFLRSALADLQADGVIMEEINEALERAAKA